VEPKNDIPFSGNLLFASRNAFLLKQQSRRDDLISLAYLLTFFIRGDLDWLKNLRPNDPQFFKKIGQVKKTLNHHKLCI